MRYDTAAEQAAFIVGLIRQDMLDRLITPVAMGFNELQGLVDANDYLMQLDAARRINPDEVVNPDPYLEAVELADAQMKAGLLSAEERVAIAFRNMADCFRSFDLVTSICFEDEADKLDPR